MKELNGRQTKFCEIYAEEPNGSRAVRLAGYTGTAANVKASQLLTKPSIQAKIAELREDTAIRTRTDIDTVRNKWVQIYERCMQGEAVMKYDKELGEFVETGMWKFDSAGAAKALENISKLNGHYEKDNLQKQSHITMELNYGSK